MSGTGKREGMTVDEYVAANLAKFPGFSPGQRDRLYGLLAPVRARLTALAKERVQQAHRATGRPA